MTAIHTPESRPLFQCDICQTNSCLESRQICFIQRDVCRGCFDIVTTGFHIQSPRLRKTKQSVSCKGCGKNINNYVNLATCDWCWHGDPSFKGISNCPKCRGNGWRGEYSRGADQQGLFLKGTYSCDACQGSGKRMETRPRSIVENPTGFRRRLDLFGEFVLREGIGQRLKSPSRLLSLSTRKYSESNERLKLGDRVQVKRWFRVCEGQIVQLPTKNAINSVQVKLTTQRLFSVKLKPCSDFAPPELVLISRATDEEARKLLTFWG